MISDCFSRELSFKRNNNWAPDFCKSLEACVNCSANSRLDALCSFFNMRGTVIRRVTSILKEHEVLSRSLPNCQSPSREVRVQPYSGSNPYVLAMAKYLLETVSEDLFGAYVHGSLGTYEEIPYADFDALAILKSEVFTSASRLTNVAMKLHDAQRIMISFDPLQHHGWFVLAESFLLAYPDHYFPVELFSHAKSLLPQKGFEFKIRIASTRVQYRESFQQFSKGIISRIEKKRLPCNLYQLKSFLSCFMLLPSLYIQARDGKGIFKKDSFYVASVDFSPDEWNIMDVVSSVRERWKYTVSPIMRKILSRPGNLSRFFANRFGPPIPRDLQASLTEEIYNKMLNLAQRMRERLS